MNIKRNNVVPIFAAIAGDVIGSWLEDKYEMLLTYKDYPLFCDKCFITDDSVFTVAIAECLLEDEITPKEIVRHLQKWGRMFPNAGFGSTTKKWIFSDNPEPYGSNRNGGAMRVSPCAVVARTLDEALELAALTCNVSHNSPEGVKGAQAIAAAIFLARCSWPKMKIKSYIEKTFGYDLDTTIEYQKQHYAGFSCKAEDTVPQAIRCFIESTNVDTAVRLAISLGSDADTLASMAAAIASSYYSVIPLLSHLKPYIPDCMMEVLEKLNDKLEQEKKERAQYYSALLCTAFDVFESRYGDMKFIDEKAARNWILTCLPDHFYTPLQRLTMDELLMDKLDHKDVCIPSCKKLKENFCKPSYIREILPEAERKAAGRLADMNEVAVEKMQQEDEARKNSSPTKTTTKITQYRYEDLAFCNGNCMAVGPVFDHYDYIDVWE